MSLFHPVKQAKQILEEARHSANLNHMACNFVKIPGHTYHLYERIDGVKYWSMLSREDWGGAPPHCHLGSYRYEHDRSWTPLEKIEDKERDFDAIQQIAKMAATDGAFGAIEFRSRSDKETPHN